MRKSLLKTAVSAVIVGAVVALSSVVAMAATETYYVSGDNGSNIAKSNDIISDVLNASGASATIKSNSTKITTINVTSNTSVGNVIAPDDSEATTTKFTKYAMSNSNSKEFTVNGSAGETVGIYYAISDSNGYADTKLKNSTVTDGSTASSAASQTFGTINYYETTIPANKTAVTITPSGYRLNVFAVTVTDASTDPSIDLPKNLDLDISNTDGIEISVNRYNASSEDGYTISWDKTGNIDMSGSGDSRIITATAAAETNTTATVTVTLKNSSNETISTKTCTINLLKIGQQLQITDNITYTVGDETKIAIAGTTPTDDYYIYLASNPSSDYIKFGSTQTVKFVLGDNAEDKVAYISVKFKSNGDSERSCVLVGDTETTLGTTGSTEITTAPKKISSGTYWLKAYNGDIRLSSLSITFVDKISNSINPLASEGDFYANSATNTYIIHALTSDNLKNDTLTLVSNSNGELGETVSTDTVYKTVKFSDDSTIVAGEGDFAGYAALYAVRLPGLIDDSKEYTLVWE